MTLTTPNASQTTPSQRSDNDVRRSPRGLGVVANSPERHAIQAVMYRPIGVSGDG
jgi:hypothetical protein